jgi:hypothetical protein
VLDVCRELGNKVKMFELPWSAFVPFLLEGVGDGIVVGEDGEMARFHHMAEMLYGFVDGQQLANVGAVLLLCRIEFFLEKASGCQAFWTCCCNTAPMAHVKASVTSASGAVGSGCASRVARDNLALHSSKALRRSGVQVLGWEPLTLGLERASCRGAWVAAAWGRNRL